MPAFASHYVGVGGLVFNQDKTKMLAIQEQVQLTNKELWKLPGGLVEVGESIGESVEREVWEETGIKAKHVGVLAFRELLKFHFSQQDMYFICLLELIDSEKIEIQMEDEIAAAQWVPLVSSNIHLITLILQDKINEYPFNYTAGKVVDLIKRNYDQTIGEGKYPNMDNLLRDFGYSYEDYDVYGNNNRFYAPSCLKKNK